MLYVSTSITIPKEKNKIKTKRRDGTVGVKYVNTEVHYTYFCFFNHNSLTLALVRPKPFIYTRYIPSISVIAITILVSFTVPLIPEVIHSLTSSSTSVTLPQAHKQFSNGPYSVSTVLAGRVCRDDRHLALKLIIRQKSPHL